MARSCADLWLGFVVYDESSMSSFLCCVVFAPVVEVAFTDFVVSIDAEAKGGAAANGFVDGVRLMLPNGFFDESLVDGTKLIPPKGFRAVTPPKGFGAGLVGDFDFGLVAFGLETSLGDTFLGDATPFELVSDSSAVLSETDPSGEPEVGTIGIEAPTRLMLPKKLCLFLGEMDFAGLTC